MPQEEPDYSAMFQTYLSSILGGAGGAGGGGSASSLAALTNPYSAAATTILGGIQLGTGLKKLKELDKKGIPKYALTSDMKESISEAKAMRGQGFTNAESAAYDDDIARGEATGFAAATDASPNLTATIQAGINYNNQKAKYRKAIGDAQLRRQNIQYSDSLNKYAQGIENMNTQNEVQDYRSKQQAYGGAVQAGIDNAMYGFTGLSGGLMGDGTGEDKTKRLEERIKRKKMKAEFKRESLGFGINR